MVCAVFFWGTTGCKADHDDRHIIMRFPRELSTKGVVTWQKVQLSGSMILKVLALSNKTVDRMSSYITSAIKAEGFKSLEEGTG